MIIDAFLYAGEADMLELRLRTLADVVDTFIAVEADVTHQGQPRACSLRTTDHRWDRWNDRLHAWHAKGAPEIPDGSRGGAHTDHFQVIERWHRDQMKAAAEWVDGLVPARQEPVIVLCSDVDEIPAPRRIDEWELVERMNCGQNLGRWLVMEQRFHSTALDLLHPQQPWLGTCVSFLENCSPQAQRDDRGKAHEEDRVIAEGGWHFSWFGTDEQRQRKLDSFSHAELRGKFDPAAARHARLHANGEPLRHLNPFEIGKLSWPEPLQTGAFIPPDGWWS